MTEEEWIASVNLYAMLDRVWDGADDRKLRLYACGCCRGIWTKLIGQRSREAVQAAEDYADQSGSVDLSRSNYWAEADGFAIDMKQDRYRQERRLVEAGGLLEEDTVEDCGMLDAAGHRLSFATARQSASAAEFATAPDIVEFFTRVDPSIHSLPVFRDIFGNPFRPVIANPTWLTPKVVAIATAIYADRACDRMSILADALEEAGCTNADVLLHCRGAGPHVRGCWVVDLVLGKE